MSNKRRTNTQILLDEYIQQEYNEFIQRVTNDVFEIYKSLGGNDRIAKSSELISSLKRFLESKFVCIGSV